MTVTADDLDSALAALTDTLEPATDRDWSTRAVRPCGTTIEHRQLAVQGRIAERRGRHIAAVATAYPGLLRPA